MHQVAKEVLEAMVPEEDAVVPGNLLCPLDSQSRNVVEVPIWIKKMVSASR